MVEHCFSCGNETGRAGRADDSIYAGEDRCNIGPLCEECRDDIVKWAMSIGVAGSITITDQRYDELVDDSFKLGQLEAAGVDNWEGYEAAMEE